jgi:hypothetical protein
MTLTPSKPKGEADERAVLESNLEAGRCYLADRGFEKYSLWNAIHRIGSDYVIRIPDDDKLNVSSENKLTQDDMAKNIVSDQIVTFGNEKSRCVLPDHPTRVVIVKVKPHDSRRRKNAQSGPSSDGFLRIVTNNLTLPAALIAGLYEQRWKIEMFFRVVKQLLGCRHLLSYQENGVMIQLCMAVIASILLQNLLGMAPNKRAYELLGWYLMGLVKRTELLSHLVLQKQRLERAKHVGSSSG